MKSSIRKLTTKKLFYNQYAFKVATLVKGGSQLRTWGADNVLLWEDHRQSYWYKMTPQDLDKLKEYIKKFIPLMIDGVKVRYEGSHVNLFIKDRAHFELVVKELNPYVSATWEPENDNEMSVMLDNNKRVIVNEYPHGCFTHKVILRHLPEDRRKQLIEWIDKYPEGEFKVSKTTRMYLEGKRHWKQDPFILVKEPKMMTMMLLSLGSYIRRTEQFVLRSSINTGSQDKSMPALSQSLLFTPADSVGTTATVAVVYPNTATSTQIYLSEKAKGDGYFGNSDGLHTAMYVASSAFVGTITMQATLATEPTNSDWFNVANTTSTYNALNIRTTATVDAYNFTGNFVWVRGYVAIDAGSVFMVQYNH